MRACTPLWRELGRSTACASGPSGSKRKRPASCRWRHSEKRSNKGKNFPKKEKAKTTQRMNNATPFEDRASRSRSTHEGESSSSLCDRLSRTRDVSQRQLPTNQDYAVSTREYQTDQSSLTSAPTAAGPVLEQQQKPPHGFAAMDRVTPYQVRVADLRTESCWNDCLKEEKTSIRPCVPSQVAYEVGAGRQQTVRSPRTMYPYPQG